MAGDKELLKENWEGKIPILFRLSEEDQFIREDCEPLFLSVRRQSYFPIVLYKVNKYFQKFLEPACSLSNSWLEDENGEKLKWHWPVGVLFDLQCLSHNSVLIPWIITVHYKNFPSTDLIAFPCQDSIKSFFMSAIKEADFLKYKGQNINSMKPEDVASLYESMVNENFEKFWSVNQQLMGLPEGYQTHESWKHVPFKVHFCNHKITQKLITPLDSSGKPHTLLDLFKMVFYPKLIQTTSPKHKAMVENDKLEKSRESTNENKDDVDEESISEKQQKPSETSDLPNESIQEKYEAGDSAKPTKESEAIETEKQIFKSLENIKFMVHGISPPLSIPIQWLYGNLTYPDNFVHICVKNIL